MYALVFLIAILFVSAILENFFNVPTISAARQAADKQFNGRGYTRFFIATALLSLLVYAVGIALMGPFIGIYNAAIQVATVYLFIFLGGMFTAILSTGKDAAALLTGGRGAGEFSTFRSTIFVIAFWGCAGSMTFYDHARTGPLLSASVHAPSFMTTK